MKTRTYLATGDDGHDYHEFEFESNSRKGSQANLEDAHRQFRRQKGFDAWKIDVQGILKEEK